MKKKSSLPNWARALERRMAAAVARGVPAPSRHAALLREGIAILADARVPTSEALALPGQPFDRHLLSISPLYRRSRTLFLKSGGRFRPALASSPRTLNSPILLTPEIEYSPIESELVWAATDPSQRRDSEHLLRLRTYSSSLFHEQSHRLLWTLLPPPPREEGGLRRYLNFVESLVVTLDMALGDELGQRLAAVFYLGGQIYDPGTGVRSGLNSREYRNYLQAALHATYLNLELYDPRQIPDAIAALYPALPAELADRAASRALQLDRGFVTRTNPAWQRKHRGEVLKILSRLRGSPWVLPKDPVDNREQYLFGERWLDFFGV